MKWSASRICICYAVLAFSRTTQHDLEHFIYSDAAQSVRIWHDAHGCCEIAVRILDSLMCLTETPSDKEQKAVVNHSSDISFSNGGVNCMRGACCSPMHQFVWQYDFCSNALNETAKITVYFRLIVSLTFWIQHPRSQPSMDTLSSTVSAIISTTEMTLSEFRHELLWALIVGIILAFVLGFGMGANDVANAFGTSVGSGVLTLKWAYILATIFETLGALLVGYNVTDTMRKNVVDLGLYGDQPKELLVGQVAILAGCSAWLLIATLAHLPVSTTHSLTGATVGFGLATRGASGIHWSQIGAIVGSWFLSPVLSGIVSSILFMIVDFSVLRRDNPLECGFRVIPIFYWFCIAFNTFAVSFQGSKLLHLSQLPLWLSVCVSLGLATVCAILVHFIMVPRLKKWIQKAVVEQHKPFDDECDDDLSNVSLSNNEHFLNAVIVCEKPPIWTTSSSDCSRSSITSGISLKTLQSTHASSIIDSVKGFFEWLMPKRGIKEDPKTMKVFSSIQLVTACFAGFAHGANDVSNAIAPLTSLIAIYTQMDVHQKGETPIYVLIFGVFAICVGLVCLGKKVIRTVGTKMSEINPASGFTIEFGAAVTTLLASKVGLPISTTHSLVGSVVAVGTIKSGEGVDWKIFRNIAISWVITLPVCGAISAGLMYLLKFTL